ncbi:MAG: type II toxin-antitoxin system VapB family antitoxin [Dermatophilaceae bacterium]
MSLNIKNERVHALARQAAQLTGRSQTGAVELALEELLRSHGLDPDDGRARAKVDHARRIVAEYTADHARANPVILEVDSLYDAATGMPR